MTRRSKRELEREVDDLGGGDRGGGPSDVVIRRAVVDENLDMIEIHERVIER